MAQVNAVAVLDMIKGLQEEIKDINTEIEAENVKMAELKGQKSNEDEFDSPVRNAAEESTGETIKELALQKEDTTMKKVMAQMMLMKQVQKKKAENNKLEQALRRLADRRKIINSALKEQKSIAQEKRLLAQREVERQKAVMDEKEEMIRQLRKQADEREERERQELRQKLRREEQARKERLRQEEEELRKENQRKKLLLQLKKNAEQEESEQRRELLEQLRKKVEREKKQRPKLQSLVVGKDFKAKMSLLDGHKTLVDRSNERILARIEEMKIERWENDPSSYTLLCKAARVNRGTGKTSDRTTGIVTSKILIELGVISFKWTILCQTVWLLVDTQFVGQREQITLT